MGGTHSIHSHRTAYCTYLDIVNEGLVQKTLPDLAPKPNHLRLYHPFGAQIRDELLDGITLIVCTVNMKDRRYFVAMGLQVRVSEMSKTWWIVVIVSVGTLV